MESGEPLDTEEETVQQPDRECSEPGCSTRLSVYNPSDRCSLHAHQWIPTTRHKRRHRKR